MDLLSSAKVENYKITTLNNDVWKINVPDPDSFRALTRKLDDWGIQWYTRIKTRDQSESWLVGSIHLAQVKKSRMT